MGARKTLTFVLMDPPYEDAPTVTALRLTPALERQIGLVRRRDKPRTPALDAFLDALEDLRRVLERRRPRHT